MKKENSLLKQIFKFLIVGGSATIIDWIIYYILYNYVKITPLIANIISYSISTIFNYYLTTKYVFNVNTNKNKKKLFILFVIFSLIGLLLSEILLYIMINKLMINKMLSKVISTILVMIFNFITKKRLLEK